MDRGSEAHIPQLRSQSVMDSKRQSQMGDNSKQEDEALGEGEGMNMGV